MQGPCLRIDCGRVGKELEDGVVIVLHAVVVVARMVLIGFLEGSVVLEMVWMCLH